MKRVLVAGATGYLGKFVVKELRRRGYWIRALARDPGRLKPVAGDVDDVFTADATRPETLDGVCEGIDIAFSSLGITRQKDGLTYMHVDYRANANILKQARQNNVGKFIYISVFNSAKLRHLEIVKAKARFTGELKASGLDYLIISPNGFFSDMGELFKMARKGRVWLFGHGSYRGNPIHGADLARFCFSQVNKSNAEIEVGGPEVLTQAELAKIAFEVLGKEARISYAPDWLRRVIIKALRTLTPARVYGPLEFLMTVMAMDMVAPKYGQLTIRQYFEELANQVK
jgi:uncharacterized protein YbjT (DUF2867 family)